MDVAELQDFRRVLRSRTLGREELSAFSTAVGEHRALFHDAAAARGYGFRDVVAAPTHPAALLLERMLGELRGAGLGADRVTILHRDQKVATHRALCAHDEVVPRFAVRDVRPLGTARTVVVVEGGLDSPDGGPFSTTRTTILVQAPEEGEAA